MKIGSQSVSNLGMGTWYLGEGDAQQNTQEIAALRYGIEHGINVIDTAEMYGQGAAESLVGQAIIPYQREQLFLISKFYPWHATLNTMRTALKNSLQRLQTNYLDLYLLHWPGDTPIKETLQGLQTLQREGLIKQYGVSNFDTADLRMAHLAMPSATISTNEVLYNLDSRGIEYDLLPYHQDQGIATIGYSPFGSGDGQEIHLPDALVELARAKQITVHQLLLAWVLRNNDVLAILKASSIDHVQANIAAQAVTWTPQELAVIDQAFPRPTHKTPLKVI